MRLLLLLTLVVAAVLATEEDAGGDAGGDAVQYDCSSGAVGAAGGVEPPPLGSKESLYSYMMLAVVITASTWLFLWYVNASPGYSPSAARAAAVGRAGHASPAADNRGDNDFDRADADVTNGRTQRRSERGYTGGTDEHIRTYRTFDAAENKEPTRVNRTTAFRMSFAETEEPLRYNRRRGNAEESDRTTTEEAGSSAFRSTYRFGDSPTNAFRSRFEDSTTAERSSRSFPSVYYDRFKDLTNSAIKSTQQRLRRFSFQRSEPEEEEWTVVHDHASIGQKYKYPKKPVVDSEVTGFTASRDFTSSGQKYVSPNRGQAEEEETVHDFERMGQKYVSPKRHPVVEEEETEVNDSTQPIENEDVE